MPVAKADVLKKRKIMHKYHLSIIIFPPRFAGDFFLSKQKNEQTVSFFFVQKGLHNSSDFE